MSVFVLGKNKKPLMPCSEKRARLLLERGRARVHKMYPFTIRLVDRREGDTQPLTLKIDPSSKQTGIAIVREDKDEASATVSASQSPMPSTPSALGTWTQSRASKAGHNRHYWSRPMAVALISPIEAPVSTT